MEPEQRGRLVVRVAALAALVIGAVVIVAVVAGSMGGEDSSEDRRQAEAEGNITACRPEAKNAVADGFYIVQQDDLLSLIAERTCVPDDELARFNPEVDPQALSPGQCVSLVEGGCQRRE